MWIVNLAAPDMMIPWGESIPFISRPESYGGLLYLGPFFNLLPVVAVAFMIVQQKMTMPPPTDEQTAMTQKLMKYMMVFMGLMFYKVAAGLCLYFIASSIWGFTERKLLPKKKKAGETTEQKLSLLQKAVARFQSEKAPAGSSNGGSDDSPSTVSKQPVNGDSGKSSPLSTSQVRRNKRKAMRSKLKGGREGVLAEAYSTSPQEEPPITGLFGGLRTRWRDTRRRLSEWWEDVLEQAKKK
jgi:membrane protein insertase Oxa1/YidC/SpoIIIJ